MDPFKPTSRGGCKTVSKITYQFTKWKYIFFAARTKLLLKVLPRFSRSLLQP